MIDRLGGWDWGCSDQLSKGVSLILPYVKGTTDRIARVLKNNNIKTVFKPHKKIHSLLRNIKGNNRLEAQGVYEVPCQDCEKTYIGRTNRKISARLEEHKIAVRKRDPSSALALHVETSSHTINYEDTKCLAQLQYEQQRIFREAIEIETNKKGLNKRDETKKLSNTWKSLLNTVPVQNNGNQPIRINRDNDKMTINASEKPAKDSKENFPRKTTRPSQKVGGAPAQDRRITRSQSKRNADEEP